MPRRQIEIRSARMIALFAAATFLLQACGALEPKFYPENKTIMSTFFPADASGKSDPEFENKVRTLLAGKDIGAGTRPDSAVVGEKATDKVVFSHKGNLLVVNALGAIDTEQLGSIVAHLRANPAFRDVQTASVSQIPSLQALRLMGAQQRSTYVIVFNSFSNDYRYANGWTIPTILLLGLPIFVLPITTSKVFVKVEYSLLEIEDDTIIYNDSAIGESTSTSTLPESGVAAYKTRIAAIDEALKLLTQKIVQKL